MQQAQHTAYESMRGAAIPGDVWVHTYYAGPMSQVSDGKEMLADHTQVTVALVCRVLSFHSSIKRLRCIAAPAPQESQNAFDRVQAMLLSFRPPAAAYTHAKRRLAVRAVAAPYTGSCGCGKVRLQVKSEPSLALFCHCSDCRAFHQKARRCC